MDLKSHRQAIICCTALFLPHKCRLPVIQPPRQRKKAEGTSGWSRYFHLRAFCLSYARGFGVLRVTGFSAPHVVRLAASSSRFFFFESFSYGMNLFMCITSPAHHITFGADFKTFSEKSPGALPRPPRRKGRTQA